MRLTERPIFDLLPLSINAALLREAYPSPSDRLAAVAALKRAGYVFDAGVPGGPSPAWRRWIGDHPPDNGPFLPAAFMAA